MGKVFKGKAKWKPTGLPRPALLLFLLTKTMKSKVAIACSRAISRRPRRSSIFSRFSADPA